MVDWEADPGFSPRLRVVGPSGAEVSDRYGGLATYAAFAAPLSGTFTVGVSDGDAGLTASGRYRLSLAASPGEFGIAAGDEGGALPPGANVQGMIHRGDVDPWTFTAAKGDRLLIAIGEILESDVDPGFSPWIRVKSPDGAEVAYQHGPDSTVADAVAPLSGGNIVLVAEGSTGAGLPPGPIASIWRSCPSGS